MQRNSRLRSINANVPTNVRFVNSTSRYLNVFWINYNGNSEYQFTMKPKIAYPINTFLTHPWFFRDKESGEYMQVKNQNIFLPPYSLIQNPRNLLIPRRSDFIVHLPMQSLRWKCLWKIATCIEDSTIVDVSAHKFEIPLALETELNNVLKSRNTWRRTIH